MVRGSGSSGGDHDAAGRESRPAADAATDGAPPREATGGPGAPLPRPGWAPFLLPGRRVVLRYRIDRRASPHGEGMTDALGYIDSADADTVTVMTRRGPDRVVRGLVTAAKEVPPPPRRRPRGATEDAPGP